MSFQHIGLRAQRVSIQQPPDFWGLATSPSHGGYLCGSRRYLTGGELRLKALLVVLPTDRITVLVYCSPECNLWYDDRNLRNFSKWERHFWSISVGSSIITAPDPILPRCRGTINIKASCRFEIDGHPIGELPVTLKTIKHALKVIVPAADTPSYKQRRSKPASSPALLLIGLKRAESIDNHKCCYPDKFNNNGGVRAEPKCSKHPHLKKWIN